MAGFGSPGHPYVEMPYAGYSAEVHWTAGASAVKWKEGQILYIQRDVANLIDSGKGVCSFWVKVLRTKSLGLVGTFMMENGYGGHIHFTLGDTHADYTDLEHLWNSRAFAGGPDAGAQISYTANEAMPELNRWYHVYIEWDTSGMFQKIMVNGVEVAADDTRVTGAGPPFINGWKTPPTALAITTAPRNFHTHICFMYEADGPVMGDPLYSVAEFWLDLDVFGLGVDKFVNVAAGTPKALGDQGQLPGGRQPKFYFARRGEPATFLVNRGAAGNVHLSWGLDLPVIAPEEGPVAEPDAPHFTPIPPALVAA